MRIDQTHVLAAMLRTTPDTVRTWERVTQPALTERELLAMESCSDDVEEAGR